MSKRLVVANWKMNPLSAKEAGQLFSGVAKGINSTKKTEVVVCPPSIFLGDLKNVSKKISLGAQDASFAENGPFTGEISPQMLAELKVKYSIVGHSERRALGETNELINKKIKEVLAAHMTPILCVGETARDPEHSYFDVVKIQLKECLVGISKSLISKIVIAYEPVWALSSTLNRRDATAHDSREMAIFIKKILSDMVGPGIGSGIRVLYGGSVNEKDAGDFLENGGVDGVLVGKASLDAKKFIQIINLSEKIK